MRELFFSERHPRLHAMAKTIIPALPMLSLIIVLMMDVLSGAPLLIKAAKLIIPGINILMMDTDRWVAMGYADQFLIIMCITAAIVAIIWFAIWRYAFPIYKIRYGNHEVKDGRLYWSSNNIWMRMWDAIYKSPKRVSTDYWIKQGLLLNPIMPVASLTRITTSATERSRRRGYEVVVDELPGRVIIGERHLTTTMDPVPFTDPDNNYVINVFELRSKDLVRSTAELSYANPHVRLDMLADASYYEDPRIFQEAKDE